MNDYELLRSIAVKDPQAFRYIYSMASDGELFRAEK